MMHEFLVTWRDDLIKRCIDKVAKRPRRNATAKQLANGVPMFIDQLTRTLEAEHAGSADEGTKISGESGGAGSEVSEIGLSASLHGKELLRLGYTVDQVVHDYGDLCQATTDLASERKVHFSIDEFRTLNRCLDNAIADAVMEFSYQRETALAEKQSVDMNERLGFLMHELRNSLHAAKLAVAAIESGGLGMIGATGSVLKRSLAAMGGLIDGSLSEVRLVGETTDPARRFSLADFILDASEAARLDAKARGCPFAVAVVDPLLALDADRELLLAALANLLHNAFKFTHHHTEVTLNAYAAGERILIDVSDNCGGLPPGNAEKMFAPFMQGGNDKSGLGLGLSIARQSVIADGGELTVKDIPGVGCTFTISLPRCLL